MFNRNVGVELGADYLLGGKNNFTMKSGTTTAKNDQYGKMIQLRPTMVVSAGRDRINPYAKVGLVIGVGGSVNYEANIEEGADKMHFVMVKDQGIAFGFTGAGGVDFGINEMMSIFSEISFTGLSFSPGKGKITKAELNGVDQLEGADVAEIEYEYVKQWESNATVDPDKPRQLTKSSHNFNSMGINIGLKFNF